MKSLSQSFCLLVLIGVILSCSKHSYNVYHNIDIWRLESSCLINSGPLCFILRDSSLDEQNFLLLLKKEGVNNKIPIDFINVNVKSNVWYRYLVASNKTPITLIINNRNNIKAIIYGTSKYALCTIKNAVANQSANFYDFGFRENSLIKLSAQSVSVLSSILFHKNEYDSLSPAWIRSYEYPYDLFLYIMRAKNHQLNDSVTFAASSFLGKYNNYHYAQIYNELISKIRTFSSYTQVNHSNINLIPNNSNVTCMVGDTVLLKALIQNTGCNKVKLLSIIPSCDCMKLIKEPQEILDPYESATCIFSFVAEVEGYYYREISVFTDTEKQINTAVFNICVKKKHL
jgi:hypothetical protein